MKDFPVLASEIMKLSPAEDANGFAERWKVDVGYIYKCNGENNWRDDWMVSFVDRKKNGIWEPRKFGS